MFYKKLYQTKFVDLIETNNFANLRFFFVFHIFWSQKKRFLRKYVNVCL